jgi:putative chitinase
MAASDDVRELQALLKARGYFLGTSGPRGDGVDGVAGALTISAALAELRRIAGSELPPVIQPRPVDSVTSPSKWQAMIDLPLLQAAFPSNSSTELARWVDATRAAAIRWGIDQPRELASWLANIAVESGDLRRLEESLNYSTDALIAKFGRHRISIADAQQYGRNALHPANQQALANILYGGEWGRVNLGNTEPGDGWKFRGFGPKQLTGRGNQSRFAAAMGMDVEDVPAFVRTPEGGMMSAGWFWKVNDLDAKAATPGVADDRRAINGGSFGLAEVERRFDKLIEVLLDRERSMS